MYINRDIEKILETSLDKGKVIVLYGARQTGKTTLVKNFFEKRRLSFLYLACEETRVKEQLIADHLALKRVIGDYTNIVLDEAQKLENPGLILKILIDNFPQLNIIASGSSSFDLANKINEPLTGRHFQFQVFPLSFSEIKQNVSSQDFSFHWQDALVFGSYPEIFLKENEQEKITRLQTLTSDYLYKDIFSFNLVRDSSKIRNLLMAIALQLGNEVSYHELSKTINSDYKTIEHYIDLLEKSFVIFRLHAFSRNLRSEINRKVKIYFYDLGVRNAIINNFNPCRLRPDIGPLFENYAITERLKFYHQNQRIPNYYFWRTYDKKEIDFIEEAEGNLSACEFKWSSQKTFSAFAKKQFSAAYPNSRFFLVSPENLHEFLESRQEDATENG